MSKASSTSVLSPPAMLVGASAPMMAAVATLPLVLPELTSSPEPVALSSDADGSKKVKAQVDRTRCAECKKKVGLTGIECRCGSVYCGSHRIAEKHACTFDFKTFGRDHIERANEKIVAQSLEEKL